MFDDELECPTDAPSRPRGRPRSAEMDEAILKATWELLAEGRYDRLTFEAVADRAGCTRPTVYRRFRNKVDLVKALVDPYRKSMEPVIREGDDPRATLLSYLEDFAGYLSAGGGAAIMALWQARLEDAEMSAMLDQIYEVGRRPYVAVLKQVSGSKAPDADYVVLVDAMLGAILFRCVHCLKSISKVELKMLVDQALAAAQRM
jgi:AcrR family transcriptional regulator